MVTFFSESLHWHTSCCKHSRPMLSNWLSLGQRWVEKLEEQPWDAWGGVDVSQWGKSTLPLLLIKKKEIRRHTEVDSSVKMIDSNLVHSEK